MTVAFPTVDDVDVVCRFIEKQTLNHVGGDPHESETADAAAVVETVREALDATLALSQRSTTLFNAIDGPVVAPSRFVAQRMPELVELHDKALQTQQKLQAEAREHGIKFAPVDARLSFDKFVECCSIIERWTLVALQLSEGRRDVASGAAVDIQDVQETYASFHENSQLFFVSECTLFDPRIQRRILMSVYFAALRDHNKSLYQEIQRLKGIEAAIGGSVEARGAKLLFKPSISEFVFLYESLQMYLAVSIIEDDVTTTTYFRILFENIQREAKNVADRLSRLPKAAEHSVSNPAPPNSSPGQPTPPVTGFTEAEVQEITNALSIFDEVRHRASELRKSIHSDTLQKNNSHRTRVPGAMPPKPQPTTLASPTAASPTSWWGSLKSVGSRLFQGATDVVTCKAEVFSIGDDVDADGTPLSKVSPMAKQKSVLESDVAILEQALDAMADGLEVEYPQLYQKDWMSTLQKSATKVLAKLESMTVVFGGR